MLTRLKFLLLIVLLVALFPSTTVSGRPEPPVDQPTGRFDGLFESQLRIEATLHNLDEGYEIPVPEEVISYQILETTSLTSESRESGHLVLYEIAIPEAVFEADLEDFEPSGGPWFQDSDWDDTGAVVANIGAQYSSDEWNSYVKVDFYRMWWNIYDPAVSISNGRLEAYCWGEYVYQTGNCGPRTEYINLTTTQPGTYYHISPSWNGLWTKYHDLGWCQKGKSLVTLTRGGNTWRFEFVIGWGG